MQSIKFETEVKIPDDLVLVSKIEFEELERNQYKGKFFDMKEFSKRCNRSSTWLKKNVLNNPILINNLKVEKGGFVYYPSSPSDRWSFQATGAIEFIDNELWKYLRGLKHD